VEVKRSSLLPALALATAVPAAAEAPQVDHQPVPCTVPARAISLCATVTDDGQVSKVRAYFRPAGDKFYSFVELEFGGIHFCGTLPAPRDGKLKAIEYYVQGVDDQFDSQRTSTYQMNVLPEGVCEFPPLETDTARAARIVVHATNKRQGKKLPDEFAPTGVSFIPVQ
jgi:hypothetical protein